MNIDHRRHVEPAASTQRLVRDRLERRLGTKAADEAWQRTVAIYEGFVADMPYTGGALNIHAHSLYDSVFLFAYWEALPADAKETVDEFRRTVSLVFNGSEGPCAGEAPDGEESSTADRSPLPVGRLIQAVGTHAPWLMRLAGPAVNAAFALESHNVRTGRWNNAWVTKANETLPEGCLLHVELVGCPVADFARTHGYQHLMPGMCNPDFDMMAPLGLHYIRPTVVAEGHPGCDMYFCLEGSPLAEASPARMDEQGFLHNELPSPQVDPKIPLTWHCFNVIAPVLRRAIRKRYGHELATACYHAARPVYRRLIDEAPRVGAGNPMATNIYTSFVPFAFYLGSEGRLTPDMLRACVDDVVSRLPLGAMARVMGLGKPGRVRAMNRRLRSSAAWAEARPQVAGTTWDFNFDDDPAAGLEDVRIHYHFTHCPINDFAREHGLLDVLPIMCEMDHVTARMLGVRLTREHTLAEGGPCCDYLFEPIEPIEPRK